MRPLQTLTLLLLAPTLASSQTVAEFRWSREIDLPEIMSTTLVAATLDSHFYQHTRENWPDVRLRNDQSESIASVIRTSKSGTSRSVRQFWSAEQLSAKVTEAAGLQVEFHLRPKEPAPSGIRIVTPLRDFEHQVQVESSVDGETWSAIGSSTVIFDYTRHVDARNDLVPFDADGQRRFRITIADLTAEQDLQLLELQRRLRGGQETDRTELTKIDRRPFRIDRIEFFRDESQTESREVQTMAYPATKFVASENVKDHQSVLELTTQREPITQIKLVTSAENFSRGATVETEREDANGKMEWQALARGVFTRFSVGTIQREELSIQLPQCRSERYRVIMENRDSPPLSVTGVELSGPIYELTFLATPGMKATLEYGSADAKPGRYDTAALEAMLAQGQSPTPVAMQAPRENSNAQAERHWTPWNDTRFLLGGIIVLTLLLGWGLFRASRRLEQIPPSDG